MGLRAVTCGDIGVPLREIELEPLEEPVPVREPEKVPA